MSNKNKLIAYELKNFAFFVILILVLGIFVTWVMQNYKIRGKDWASESEGEKGILSEGVSPVGDTCIFYVGTNLSETTHKYLNQMEIPLTDDGFIAGFFEIPGLNSVIVNKKNGYAAKVAIREMGNDSASRPRAHQETFAPALGSV